MGFWSELVHGTNEEGKEVTAKFGSGPREGHTLLADGHKSEQEFDAHHDHYDGRGNSSPDSRGGGTERGAYTGEGS